ncbi:MAG: hypothetical protein WCP35_04045 [Verrucomicrobiota bacterium]
MDWKFLHSPLAGTAGVLATMALLAIPLHHLTSNRTLHAAEQFTPPPASDTLTPAILRLKLLAPARSLRLTTEDGTILLDLTDVAAGESECESALPIHQDSLDLLLKADFGDSPADTAVFLTVMPDIREAQTRYLLGSGSLVQPLRFNWHSP